MRHFNQVAGRTVERAERSGETFSLLMCDLDYLRNINNTYGHQAGDTVLLGIADILRRKVGPNDAAARFGGEEFVILLADTDGATAMQRADELRAELEGTRFEVKGVEAPIGATISIGVAAYPSDGRTIEALMHEADLAVYQAKRDGRNRVVVAGRVSRELAAEWAREHLVHSPASDAVALPSPMSRPFWNFINDVTRNSINIQVASVLSLRQPRRPEALTPARHGQPAPASQGPAPSLLLLIALIVIAGLAGLLPVLQIRYIPWWPLLLFTSLTVVASELAVDTHGRGKTSVATVAKISAALLFGELGILVTALASALTLKIKAHSPLHRMFFNFGTFLLSAEGARGIFTLLVGGSLAGMTIERALVPATLAGLTFYAINHLLLCLVRGLNEGRPPWQIWHADYRWLWPHYAVLGVVGLIVAVGYQVFGWLGVIGLMSPVAMMHLAIKQYTERTTIHVNELTQLNNRLTDSYEATLLALSRALDTRDEETEEHSRRVKRYTHLIANWMGIAGPELDDILRGALLHDIGKIGVPDAILLKPGRLDEHETMMMRQHPEIGHGMITHIPFLAGAARIVLHHHEAYDGSGYPSKLAGASIPLGARMFAIADTFDAMTSDRPYRAALPIAAGRAEIERCRGAQFDPAIVDIFLSIPIAELIAARNDITVDTVEPDLNVTSEMILAYPQETGMAYPVGGGSRFHLFRSQTADEQSTPAITRSGQVGTSTEPSCATRTAPV